jgi:carbohydrate kinase (thermoresistant glucokinase family)
LNWKFEDADDHHPEENKKLMQQGISLNDANRLPWLLKLRKILVDWHVNKESGILACSALKESYRHLLNSNQNYSDEPLSKENNESDKLELNLLFVLLNFKQNIIEDRLAYRINHPILKDSRILISQFQTLEVPSSLTNRVLLKDLFGYLCIESSSRNLSFYYFYNFFYNLTFNTTANDVASRIKDVIIYVNLINKTTVIE